MKTIDVFEVTTNTDRMEGRGNTIRLAYMKDECEAWKVAAGKGIMGSDADVNPIVLNIYDTYEEYYKNEWGDKKKAILAKLTFEEKQILGLI